VITLLRILHTYRRTATSIIYASIAAASYSLAFLLRFDFAWPSTYSGVFLWSLALLVVVRGGLALATRLGTGSWRYVGLHDLLRLTLAATAGSILFFAITWGLPVMPRVPRSVIVMEWLLTGNLTAAVWVTYRLICERRTHRDCRSEEIKRVLVVGAGRAGQMLVREMVHSPTGHTPVGFVDDDTMKWDTLIHGVEVIGSVDDLAEIAKELEAEQIFIAIPSAEPAQLRRIIEHCENLDLGFKLLPGIREVIEGDAQVHQLREVRLEDLLGRNPIQLELAELSSDLEGETVLITGAAGSIGSELARQVALYAPAKLILIDQAETPLYYIDLELVRNHPDLDVEACLLDVTDCTLLDQVFARHKPSRVFHAAAYKHVPMMEGHPGPAVHNNVLGTWRVAKAAGEHGAERFILVSTDKAVRPANIMGATKRISELVTLYVQAKYPKTAFGAVRFGNVLGSNGSVIPLFKRQLDAGEPLTVTHQDVTRFFMTIPEAVQLILHASLLPRIRGGIAMLEMGEPVPIIELAKDLLRLSGKSARLGRDIVITGLRPGEKLHEELAAPDETAIQTGIEKVNLLDTNGARLPEPIAEAIEEERIEDVLAYLKSEILVVDLETEIALDVEKDFAQNGRVRLGSDSVPSEPTLGGRSAGVSASVPQSPS
jgi:FlaA1/EpsC-like NDP-sugar epimerase